MCVFAWFVCFGLARNLFHGFVDHIGPIFEEIIEEPNMFVEGLGDVYTCTSLEAIINEELSLY